MEYPDIGQIKKAYQRFEDEKIIKIAKEESKGLRKEVIPILMSEIETRQLDSKLKEYILANRRKLTNSEKEELRRKVKSSLCSLCRRKKDLAGYRIVWITGIIIDTILIEQNLIICKSCGEEKSRRSYRQTMILGWWSFWGIIQTSAELINKTKNYIMGEESANETIIDDFLDEYMIPIILNEDDEQIIRNLLVKYNRRELNK